VGFLGYPAFTLWGTGRSTRQIQTTVPPLARGVTPVIACSGGGGGLLGRVQRGDVPDLQRVVLATADDPLPVGAETHAGDTA
jgi:hypothetical protein